MDENGVVIVYLSDMFLNEFEVDLCDVFVFVLCIENVKGIKVWIMFI